MLKILMVEDNGINRDLFRRRLERTGDREIVASDSAKGVTKTQAEPHRPRNHL
jgi:CheY-like chemotaxis protein